MILLSEHTLLLCVNIESLLVSLVLKILKPPALVAYLFLDKLESHGECLHISPFLLVEVAVFEASLDSCVIVGLVYGGPVLLLIVAGWHPTCFSLFNCSRRN